MSDLNFVILAAGKGTRMRSTVPKVLHKLAGRAMLAHVVAAVDSLGDAKKVIVTGHGADEVEQQFNRPDIEFVQQKKQLGTAHAVQMAIPKLSKHSIVMVLYGDVPLIKPSTISKILEAVTASTMSLLTISLVNPGGYGRIIRDSGGIIEAIVEQKDATDEQLKINEVNTGVLALQAEKLLEWIPQINNNNAQGEYYLTDIIAIAKDNGTEVIGINPESASEVEGVNSRVQLSQLERAHQHELAEKLMASGTSLADPSRFDQRGDISSGIDNFIDINCIFEGMVTIGNNVSIGANCHVTDSTIGDGVQILPNTILESTIVGARSVVGPFARLRPGTELASDTKVGNFVETKKALVGKGSKINHLSYVGDAQLGENVNIGAGTITCNYDGVNKHQTDISDGVFIGSNSTLVAPIKVGKDGFVAAGSTVTSEVPNENLAVARAKQRNIKGWKRPSKKED
jgi:bifunctional UDP-N-acetylglucosamine pyrophosphorylase/glucosamine-1-phosphate N-acetyltransferase